MTTISKSEFNLPEDLDESENDTNKFSLSDLPSKIDTLDLKNIFIDWNDMRLITHTKIQKLDLFGCEITDKCLKYFNNIDKIILSAQFITDNGLKYLINIDKITIYQGNKITDNGMRYLSNASVINLSECVMITDRALEYIRGKIFIHNCPKITIRAHYFINHDIINLSQYKSLDTNELRYFAAESKAMILPFDYHLTTVGAKYLYAIKHITFSVGSDFIALRYLTNLEHIFFPNWSCEKIQQSCIFSRSLQEKITTLL